MMRVEGVRYVELGKTRERISEIGLGTWKMGRDEAGEIGALRAGMKAGVSLIDTAEMYGTEELVGHAIRGGYDAFVTTKVTPTHFRYEQVLKACHASLKRLHMKSIDLYQLHWPNPGIPIAETMEAMEKLVAEGKIRHIGVSNFSLAELEEAQAAMKRNEIVSNQVEYSIFVRDVEKGLLQYCRKEHISVIAYSPLARGRLFMKSNTKLHQALAGIGRARGKTATQVALNWLMTKGAVPIPKASDKDHVLELVGSCGWNLSQKEMAAVDSFL